MTRRVTRKTVARCELQAEPRCAAVVLAAGGSSRLGQPKQLLRINGETLVGRTARLAHEAGFTPVYVVVGAHAEAVREELGPLPVIAVENAEWQSGMGSSVRSGVNAALAGCDPAHLLLLVCDQPALSADVLCEMRKRHLKARAPVTAACYAGRLAVPALFARDLFRELLEIGGDTGARDVLLRHRAQAVAIPFEAGAGDIDYPADLIRLTPSTEGKTP